MFFPSPSPSTISSDSSQVSDEEFLIFHTSDRQLFGRMVFSVGCDISDSMQVIAFWIWLERSTGKYLVEKILTMSDLLIGTLINESLLCIKSAESEVFPYGNDAHGCHIPFLQGLTMKDISCRYFHDNRVTMLKSIQNIVQDVCYRAFHEIIPVAVSQPPHDRVLIENSVVHGNKILYPRDHLCGLDYRLDYNIRIGDLNVPVFPPNHMLPSLDGGEGSSESSGHPLSFGPTSFNPKPQVPPHIELTEFMRMMRVNDTTEGEKRELPLDDRTIFLTFSKGYPISADEVREFFTRAFGDVIEALYMQDVSEEEQALYARLVVRDPKTMEEILGGRECKMKFSINGKHVWARKYVQKNSRALSFAPCSEAPPRPADKSGA
ncbi:hypothetical protein AKJ16_DCAP16764 [Drosera capensis]